MDSREFKLLKVIFQEKNACSLCTKREPQTQRRSCAACNASDREAQFTAQRHKPATKMWGGDCASSERKRERERDEEKLQAADQNHTSCNNKHPRDHSDIWKHVESLGAADKRWGGGCSHLCIHISLFFSGFKAEIWFQSSESQQPHQKAVTWGLEHLIKLTMAAEITTQTRKSSFKSHFLRKEEKMNLRDI